MQLAEVTDDELELWMSNQLTLVAKPDGDLGDECPFELVNEADLEGEPVKPPSTSSAKRKIRR